RCFRSAATLGACLPRRASLRISSSSGISPRITASSPAAGRRSPSPRGHPKPRAEVVASTASPILLVMPGLVPGTHDLGLRGQDVDGRDKPGHDRDEGVGAMPFDVGRRLAAEALGTLILVMAVIGSGIMAETLSGGNQAVALLCNTIATGAVLYVI